MLINFNFSLFFTIYYFYITTYYLPVPGKKYWLKEKQAAIYILKDKINNL